MRQHARVRAVASARLSVRTACAHCCGLAACRPPTRCSSASCCGSRAALPSPRPRVCLRWLVSTSLTVPDPGSQTEVKSTLLGRAREIVCTIVGRSGAL
ncbi:unnamed protein product [Leptidea sinapis]|uniref:Uncharacterized protein n=1 Tax=Leptidea sinapis TaxID=189913 RepID=A0A5E4QGD4_9NEOP|nr:unnamed protein product [Leptidea sinapis]